MMQNLKNILPLIEQLGLNEPNNNSTGISIQVPAAFFISIIEEIKELNKRAAEPKSDSMGEVYLSTNEVAKLLDCTNQTVHNYRTKGILVPAKINGKNIYRKSDIVKLINDNIQSRKEYYES